MTVVAAIVAAVTVPVNVGLAVIATLPVPLMLKSSGTPVPLDVRPMTLAVAMFAIFAKVTTPGSIVHFPALPVTVMSFLLPSVRSPVAAHISTLSEL